MYIAMSLLEKKEKENSDSKTEGDLDYRLNAIL